MATSLDQATNHATKPPRLSRLRRLITPSLVILGLAVLIFVTRDFWLRNLASALIVDESISNPTAMLLLSGDLRYDIAARFVREDAHRTVLLEQSPPGRLIQLGILPSSAAQGRQELVQRGVPEVSIGTISWDGDDGPLTTAMTKWLQDRPDEQLVIVCEAFVSRELRWKIDRVLPAPISRRIAIRGLPNTSYGPSNWWRTKSGISSFALGWIGLILPIAQFGQQAEWNACNPEQFQPATP